MNSYSPVLEKTRVPQPSLQRLAVISVFEKLRSTPSPLGPDSDPGRDAITHCLSSDSPAVVDQSVRELCRLVKDSKLDLFRGLLELQSALESSDSRFVNVFVKGLGFIVRLGFHKDSSSFRFPFSEAHPFTKILSCRTEAHSELVQQVLLFIVQNKQFGMVEVCEFLRPFLNFSVIRMPFSESFSTFARNLVSAMASLCCSFPLESLPLFRLLMACLKYFPSKNAEEFGRLHDFVECLGDAYVMVLRQLVRMGLLVHEAQLCGVELLEALFSLRWNLYECAGRGQAIVEISRRLLAVQAELGLGYIPKLSSVMLYVFAVLISSELEHQQLVILKFLLFLFDWKTENEHHVDSATNELNEELLLLFPVINLVSSPSASIRQAAMQVLSVMGKLAINLLMAPKKELTLQEVFPSVSRPENIIFRLLQRLWFQDQSSMRGSFYLSFASFVKTDSREVLKMPQTWTSAVREYSLWIVERLKSSLRLSESQELFIKELPLFLSSVAGLFVMHQTLESSAIDLLALFGKMDSKLGVPLLLLILFYNHILSGMDKNINFHGKLLKLLEILPSLGSHPAMVPLVVQTILPMLHEDVKPVLYATAIRLLYKTWEINDRVFGNLQGILLPKGFSQFASKRDICISMAASIRDVCKRNPDRGVDLILSVSACIESQDPIVKALGFQSLACLCEADVIDFYTAWSVVAKHVSDLSGNPFIAQSVCLLLRWGALDAEAYPEAAVNVLQLLWEVGTSRHSGDQSLWAKARASAIESLTHYEVLHIQKGVPDIKERTMELLISEANLEVLKAIERFEVKIITYEHITRRRFVREKRALRHKIEKLLYVFPQVIFASGSKSIERELPSAALFCLSFSPKDVNNLEVSKVLRDIHARYENALVEIAASHQLSRNIFIALLSLQSWESFMQRWMESYIMFLDSKDRSTSLDKTSIAANDILKIMRRIAEDSLPRSAENIALAVGALCMVLPPSAHAVKTTASKFLLNWLSQNEHEYRQWSAAISLGLISSCLHVTDYSQKLENINVLIEVSFGTKSTLVKGACGVGLGFTCQDLLTKVEPEYDSLSDNETYKLREADLLGKIIKVLCEMISSFTPSATDIVENLSACFPQGIDDIVTNFTFSSWETECDELEEDVWGVAGLVLGLASSIRALYRVGAHDAVIKTKDLIISWIPHVNPSFKNSAISERWKVALSVGSSLALPIVVAFCQSVELIDNAELDYLVSGYRELISELLSLKKTGTLYQSLLMASCIGAGSLVSCISNGGVHSMEVRHVKDLLALFRKSYSDSHHPLIHLGGMLGVVNALGAGAGTLVQQYPSTFLPNQFDQKESSYVIGSLLSSPELEPDLTSMIQEIFLVAQKSDDHQLQQYASWAISFLRHQLLFIEHRSKESYFQAEAVGSENVTRSFPENAIVMKLSTWLMHLNYPGTGKITHVNTVLTTLRCLSHAPMLPPLDWGLIIRRCMRYEGQVAELLPVDSALKKGILREECIEFSLAHANQFDQLLNFLDELSGLPRLRTLELNLQSCILCHLADLTKIFAASRIKQLFDDVANFISWSAASDHIYDPKHISFLRISCWKGIFLCLNDTSVYLQEYITNIENCMEVLFAFLPDSLSTAKPGVDVDYLVEEWHVAVRCLGNAQKAWLFNFLQISDVDSTENYAHLSKAVKKILARVRLVQIGSIPLSELGKLKVHMLNTQSQAIWDILVEVAAALLQAEGSVRRQWLVDTVEISCVTHYPSTALQFLGLLCGSCSKYMPFLILDPFIVLNDLPVILASLLSETSWSVVAESVVSYLWTSTERIHDLVTSLLRGDESPSQQPIDKSENDVAGFLLQVLHHACVLLKDCLSPDKQIRLANMQFS